MKSSLNRNTDHKGNPLEQVQCENREGVGRYTLDFFRETHWLRVPGRQRGEKNSPGTFLEEVRGNELAACTVGGGKGRE